MIQVAIAGILGRMGQNIYQAIAKQEGMTLSVATAKTGDAALGKTVRSILGGESEVIIRDALTEDFDVLIDFTNTEASISHLAFCRAHNKAIVIGTTGFSAEDLAHIQNVSAEIPVFMSANMSVGVNVMQQLVQIAAKALYPEADIEILEAHHRNKIDAPSGTALMLGNSIAQALDLDLDEKGVFSRHGITGARKVGDIGFSTIRGGDVVGDHSVFFLMAGERLSVSHQATDRQIFANGALFAAKFLINKGAGFYDMRDALGLLGKPSTHLQAQLESNYETTESRAEPPESLEVSETDYPQG